MKRKATILVPTEAQVPGRRGPLRAMIEVEIEQKFDVGEYVRIVGVLDAMTSREIIGHWGVVEEFDEDAWPQAINYEIDCQTCDGCHYMHQEELAAYKPEPTRGARRMVV